MSRTASHLPSRAGATATASTDARELHETLAALAGFTRRHVRKFTRLALALVIVAIVLHAVHPPAIEMLNHWLGFKEATLPGLLALSLAIFITERVVVLEGNVHAALRRKSVQLYESRAVAYEHVFAKLGDEGARTLDLLQFSGHNVVPLINRLAMTSPNAVVRLLLAAPESADCFDTDGAIVHSTRIQATLGDARVLLEDGIRIELRFYDSVPGLAAVIVDDTFAVLSWYVCRHDGNDAIPRLRGHNSAAVTVADRDGRGLLTFARRQFDAVWESARPAPLEPKGMASAGGAGPTVSGASASGSPSVQVPISVVTPGTTATTDPSPITSDRPGTGTVSSAAVMPPGSTGGDTR